MKSSAIKVVVVVIGMAGAFFLGQYLVPVAQAVGLQASGTLSSSGSASVQLKPDSARVYFKIETWDEDPKKARQGNNNKAKMMLEALKGLHIPDLKAKSSSVSIKQVLERPDKKLPRILGYHMVNEMTVLVESQDAAKLSEWATQVVDTVLDHGATDLQEVDFFRRDADEVRRQVMTKAMEDALANARALLGPAKKTNLEVTEIRPDYGYRRNLERDGRTNSIIINQPQAVDTDTVFVIGDLVISCQVTITCKY